MTTPTDTANTHHSPTLGAHLIGRSLVLGATGFLGLNVVEHLRAEGLSPRCAHRARSNTIMLRRLRVERATVDLDDENSIANACAGIDTVFHLAGHYPRHALDPDASIPTARRETRHVLEACARAGIKRLVFVSSTATVSPRHDGHPSTEADMYPDAPDFGTYHAVKWHMEAMVLAEDRFDVAIACPGACIGAWDLRVGTSALLVGVAHGAPVVWPDGIVNLADVRDVAAVLAQLGATPHPPRRTIIAGHDVRLSEFLPYLALRFGAPPPPAPVSAETAMAFADREERRCLGTTERPGLSREIADLIIHGTRLDTRLGRSHLGRPWHTLDETIHEFERFARMIKLIPVPPPPPPPLA